MLRKRYLQTRIETSLVVRPILHWSSLLFNLLKLFMHKLLSCPTLHLHQNSRTIPQTSIHSNLPAHTFQKDQNTMAVTTLRTKIVPPTQLPEKSFHKNWGTSTYFWPITSHVAEYVFKNLYPTFSNTQEKWPGELWLLVHKKTSFIFLTFFRVSKCIMTKWSEIVRFQQHSSRYYFLALSFGRGVWVGWMHSANPQKVINSKAVKIRLWLLCGFSPTPTPSL